MDASLFFTNFWPGLAANLVAGLILSFVIAQYIDFGKRVKAVINGYYFADEGVLQLSMSNYSNYYLKSGEVFYSLYVVESLLSSLDEVQSENFNLSLSQRDIEIKNQKYVRFSGTTTTNCFAGTKVGLSRIKIKAASTGDILFYVSTVHGPSPKRAAKREPGLINLEKLGTVVIEKR